MSRTILVATDGSDAALGALRFAKALAEARKHEVRVLGVVEPVPVFDAGFMVAFPELELFESRKESLRREILAQIHEIAEDPEKWPLSVVAGTPGPRIVQHAADVGASAILLGLGRHRPMDRVFGTETTLQVLRVSHIPVLAVPDDLGVLPRSAVIGVDFSLFSRRTLQATAAFLTDPCEIHLVHVLSGMEFLPTLSEDWRGSYEAETLQRLSELAEELEDLPGSEIRLHVLEGEPSHQILTFARGKGAGLLAAGSHGHSFVGRLLMGSVSTRLVRSARIPVLVVPPGDRSPELFAEGDGHDAAVGWVKELQEFTRRNAGRRSVLELEERDGTKQECGRHFPLWGVDYDPRSHRVNIMLGRSGTVDGHLTHSLSGPVDIRVVPGSAGEAEALEITLPNGKAILRMSST